MKVTREDVAHVAHLARLRFDEEALGRFTEQMNAILTYMEQLGELDTAQVEPTSHAMALSNVFREDEVRTSLPVDGALANAPRRSGSSFQVPRVIE
jgi:aspartyl-tRNA(Asn)/glutamyl-tRNA(Gln) amidotransferase subunit C